MEREALNVCITVCKIRQPAGICSVAQGAQICPLTAWGWDGEGLRVRPWLSHVDAWQKQTEQLSSN